MKNNVAIIGTFDLENFGDLMFPIVFKKQLEKRIDIENLFLFSPNECQMPLNPDELKVYSIDKLEKIHNEYGLDAIVFGGGDLVRLDTELAPEEKYVTLNTPFDMMVYSAVIANKYGIPCLWNCPGVPFEFSSDEKKLMKCLLDDFVDYVSVREERSAEILNACGCENKVNVSPDTVLSVSKLIDKNENGIFEGLKEEFSFLNSGYIVFQAWVNNIENFDEEIKNQLAAISDKSGKKVVFLAIGNVHKDDEHIEQMLALYKNDNFVAFNRKLNIYETNTVLGNADAFIGTSLHGNIVSNSYGVPSIGLNLFDFVKLKNYFKLVSRSEYCVKNIAELEKTYFDMMAKNTTEQIAATLTNIDNHFDVIAKNVGKKTAKTGDIKQLLDACYNLEKSIKDNCITVFFDCGNGFATDSSEVILLEKNYNKISLTINVPKDTKQVRIDPLDNAYCALSNVKITAGGKKLAFSGNFIVADDKRSELLFLNNDPQILVNVDSSVCELNVEFDLFGLTANSGALANAALEKTMATLSANIDAQKAKIDSQLAVISKKEAIIAEKDAMIADYDNRYNQLNAAYIAITNSFFWKLTHPLRKISQKMKNFISRRKKLLKFAIGIKGFLRGGFKGARTQIQNYNAFVAGQTPGKVQKTVQELLVLKKSVKSYQQKYNFDQDIKFSILVPLYNTPQDFLAETIDSVRNQTYQNWELCLADGSDQEHDFVGEYCLNLAQKDSRIKYKKLDENKGIADNTNECLTLATGNYIALFDHDDLLHPSVLFEYAKQITENGADFIYCDEATFVCEEGKYKIILNHHKPEFSPDTLRSYNYICHFTCFARTLYEIVGGFNSEYDGSQDYDLILRLTEKATNIIRVPKLLYFWRAHALSVASGASAKPYVVNAAEKALAAHLERIGLKGTVKESYAPTTYKIDYEIIGNPLVSIVIPTKDHIEDLDKCITSIISKSTYNNYEIIVVENNSTESETFEYYEKIQSEHQNIKVVFWKEKVFNYSAINNFGIQYANGEYVLLLNNDIEIITPNWLEEMLMFAQRNDVGAVGAKLYFDDDTIQHAGVILGIGGVAGHSHKYFDRKAYGYVSRACVSQNLSACTAACLLIRKDVLEKVEGLDEGFAVAFNDIDLCMKIRKAGYLIVFTPYAEFYHYESKSRGYEDSPEKVARFNGEISRFMAKWGEELEKGDPYYNPNLTLTHEDFSLK